MKQIVSLSGGKDSLAMSLRLLEEGEEIEAFLFCDTGYEYPETYAALEKFEQETGRKITRLVGDYTFDQYAIEKEKKIKPGKIPKRLVGYGWPHMMRRWCTAHLKREPLERFRRQIGKDCIHLVGIAADEGKRIREEKDKRYPLVEWGMTESDCLAYCKERGYYQSPCAYDVCKRMSCFLCPLMNNTQIRYLVNERPELWGKIKELEEKIGEPWKERGTEYYERKFRVPRLEYDLGEI